jgi:hypothetical protein
MPLVKETHRHREVGVELRDCYCSNPSQSVEGAERECREIDRAEYRAMGLIIALMFLVLLGIAGRALWILLEG